MANGKTPVLTNEQVLRDWVTYLIDVFETALPYLVKLTQQSSKARPLINEFAARSQKAEFWRETVADVPKEALGHLFYAFALLPDVGQKLNTLGSMSEPDQQKLLKDIQLVLQSLKAAKSVFK